MENLLKVKKDFLEGYLRISDLYQKNKQFDKAILILNKILSLSEKKIIILSFIILVRVIII